jgi:adenine-specific DNA-methyltransferase
MARVKKPAEPMPVEAVLHQDKRVNIPTGQQSHLVEQQEAAPAKVLYPRDSSLDPQLVWKGKDQQDAQDLAVPAVPIYIQEKIDPRALIENLRVTAKSGEEEPEYTLFADFDGFGDLDFLERVDFYRHEGNWHNRLILGDSLVVMTSLAEKENLRGKVQMIYVDPPYGIKFGSNWQVSTRKREVGDGKLEDASREPEVVKAFRDTWELGIHSYLAYLRERLVVARDLLTETGSIFVQIGDENVHLVRSLMDEVFGAANFVSLITFTTTTTTTGRFLPATSSFLLWYGLNVDRMKFRPLHGEKIVGQSGATKYDQSDETGRPYTLDNLTSPRVREARTGYYAVELEGRTFFPKAGEWKTNQAGMHRLLLAGRVKRQGNTLRYVRFLDDFSAYPLGNVWTDVGGIQSRTDPKVYVVQTSTTIVERCILMTTDPGDLVLDPTCGAGTTAYAAEEWGRRWITTDTSRVALALARTRLMSARFPYYLLADSEEGAAKEADITGQPLAAGPFGADVRKGFIYRRVPHVTLKSIAQNPDIGEGMSKDEIGRRHCPAGRVRGAHRSALRRQEARAGDGPIHGRELVAAQGPGGGRGRRSSRRRSRGRAVRDDDAGQPPQGGCAEHVQG